MKVLQIVVNKYEVLGSSEQAAQLVYTTGTVVYSVCVVYVAGNVTQLGTTVDRTVVDQLDIQELGLLPQPSVLG